MTTLNTGHGAPQDPEGLLRYATEYHAPVLCKAVIEGLVTDLSGCYVDATLGGGGHSAALLSVLNPDGQLIGVDQDAEALEVARQRLGNHYPDQFRTLEGNFGYLDRILDEAGIEVVDGILLDLGVSSHQIDRAERGFSYITDGPLDMRMDQTAGLTADEIVNQWSLDQLTRLLRNYGEEPGARAIARRIIRARPVRTTGELADIVRSAVPKRIAVKTLARTFQAIRIMVNDELAMLERALEISVDLLKPGGRIAVISYHSLEDRRVKRFFRYGNLEGQAIRDLYGNLNAPLRPVTRKPVSADDAEVRVNPRARSARLRIAEKIDPSVDTANKG